MTVYDTDKDHQVRPWRDVALMFYQAMLANKVAAAKAKTMYYAVYVFGPHWGNLQAGINCGRNCINNAQPGVAVWSVSPPDYDNPGLVDEVRAVQAQIEAAEASGAPFSLDRIQAEAKARHPRNGFITPSAVPGLATE